MALIKHFQQDGIRIGCMILVFGLGFGCPVRAVSHRSGFLAENCPSAGGFEPWRAPALVDIGRMVLQ